jgi:hypothetical protein
MNKARCPCKCINVNIRRQKYNEKQNITHQLFTHYFGFAGLQLYSAFWQERGWH